jgi:ligand-binding SRPBCC domain-containing protein
MARFEHTTEIEAPVETVFAFLAEPANLPRLKHLLEDNRPR